MAENSKVEKIGSDEADMALFVDWLHAIDTHDDIDADAFFDYDPKRPYKDYPQIDRIYLEGKR